MLIVIRTHIKNWEKKNWCLEKCSKYIHMWVVTTGSRLKIHVLITSTTKNMYTEYTTVEKHQKQYFSRNVQKLVGAHTQRVRPKKPALNCDSGEKMTKKGDTKTDASFKRGFVLEESPDWSWSTGRKQSLQFRFWKIAYYFLKMA